MRRPLAWISIFIFALSITFGIPINNVRADTKGVVDATLTFVVTRKISIDDVFVVEGEAVVFTVSLSGATDETVTVDYATADGTAIASEDYTSTNGDLTFESGETTATITIQTLDDGSSEDDETFYVDLSNPTGPAKIADGRGVATIADDDSNPASIIINNDTQYEGNSLEFLVSLSTTVTETVTVQYYTVDDTALSGEDYEGVPETSSLTLSFQPGETEKTINIDSLEDITAEPSERFQVVLENPSGPAVILDGEGIGTILDDDPSAPEEEEAGAVGEVEQEEAGGAGEAETPQSCTPICPPALPLLSAEKTDKLSADRNENGVADSGDVIQYEVVIDKVSSGNPGDMTYLEPISPHLQILESSMSSISGETKTEDVGGNTLLRIDFLQGSNQPEFPIRLTYKARVKDPLPEGVGYIKGQGIVYSDSLPSVVTDDPSTPLIYDSTWTPTAQDGSFEEKVHELQSSGLVLEKSIITKETPEQPEKETDCESCSVTKEEQITKRFAENGTAIKFGMMLKNSSGEKIKNLTLINPVDRHLTLDTESVRLDGNPASLEYDSKKGVFALDLPPVDSGGAHHITYWATFQKEEVPPDLGYFGNRAYLFHKDGTMRLSDDPETRLLGDRPTVLLSTKCNQENYQKRWEKWFDRISQIESGLVPVIFSSDGRDRQTEETEQKEEVIGGLNWVALGNESDDKLNETNLPGGLSEQPGSTTFLPGYRFAGTAEFEMEPGVGSLYVGVKSPFDSAGSGGSVEETSSPSYFVQGFDKETVFRKVSSEGELTPLSSPDNTKKITWCNKGYLPFISELGSEGTIGLGKSSEDFLNLVWISENVSVL